MIVYPLGNVRAGGGALFVFVGPANTALVWNLAAGSGTITPVDSITNGAGVACAVYNGEQAAAGETITVRVTLHA